MIRVQCDRGCDRTPMDRCTTMSAMKTRHYYKCPQCGSEVDEPACTASHNAYVEHNVVTLNTFNGLRTTTSR